MQTALDAEIGLSARRYLADGFAYVILVDDLAHDHRDHATDVFQRYRLALDTILNPVGWKTRASVHFLVNMLEAYYFAHAAAINRRWGQNWTTTKVTSRRSAIPRTTSSG